MHIVVEFAAEVAKVVAVPVDFSRPTTIKAVRGKPSLQAVFVIIRPVQSLPTIIEADSHCVLGIPS